MHGDHSDAARLPEAETARWQTPFAVICALVFANVVAAEPPATKVEWKASLLSVMAEKADIVPVLETVQSETGLEIQGLEQLRGLPEPKRTISVTFENLPLADGLRTLLSGFSYGVVEFYKPKPGTPGLSLYLGSQQGTPQRREDETKTGAPRGAAAVTVHVEDESGNPIAIAAAPEQPRAVSPPAGQPEENKGSDSAAADHAQTDAK